MSYGKVKESFWTDRKVRSFSDDAKMLALYLLTGPHRNIIGCMRVPDGYIAADLGWQQARISRATFELSDKRFLLRDDEGWTLILNQLRHDPIKVPNHAKSGAVLADEVPRESPVFQPFADRFEAALEAANMQSVWHRDAKPTPEPLPEPEPLPSYVPNGTYVPVSEAAPANPPDELRTAVDEWNAVADDLALAKVQRLTESRKRSLRQRLAECGGMEGWRDALAKVRDSPFLRGETDANGWRPDFDWLLKPKSFTKLIEGGYAARAGPNGRGRDAERESINKFFEGLSDDRDGCGSEEGHGSFPEADDGFAQPPQGHEW